MKDRGAPVEARAACVSVVSAWAAEVAVEGQGSEAATLLPALPALPAAAPTPVPPTSPATVLSTEAPKAADVAPAPAAPLLSPGAAAVARVERTVLRAAKVELLALVPQVRAVAAMGLETSVESAEMLLCVSAATDRPCPPPPVSARACVRAVAMLALVSATASET